ncbi:Pc20g14000 [Penicillium rubens Wisconsin 54-1255]|uniref:Pc20g14000 protein n=1 Tax=Penicillium rubens (strain ATCC 28089 / DSM 1075 / NRRL 1951 / Wisconsin 54-1255) TaxID=500485 RepID=B6HH37_PENRW|nr:Pc20g14000 [Penicillium rubens Wisconsin 54-1255]
MGGQTSEANLSLLWEKAEKRYHQDLASDKELAKILETRSLEELLADTHVLQPADPFERELPCTIGQLEPAFKSLSDFLVILKMSYGADSAQTALVWGSIRVILTLASTADSILQDIFDMIEELAWTLPRLKCCEHTISMGADMEIALLALYQEFTCFYARTIRTFRDCRHSFLLRSSWPTLRADFHRTIQRAKRLSSDIEREVDLSRVRLDNEKYRVVLDFMAELKTQRSKNVNRVAHYLPFAECSHFYGRDNILRLIDEALFVYTSTRSLRSFALHGMGGVGKTQIALKYANASREKFDVILWISAENPVTIWQSFRRISKILDLIEPDTELDDYAIIVKVKDWLSAAKTRWLLIYDNADDLSLIKHTWPAGYGGSVLVTSRDPTAPLYPASAGCQVPAFDTENGTAALLDILGLDSESTTHQAQAKLITSKLGGLPLALNQIGGFLAQRQMPLEDFLAFYNRNSLSVDAKGSESMDSSHTLATVWETSLSQLSPNAKVLHMILSFLDPNGIDESVLKNGANRANDPALRFMVDEIEFLDTQKELRQRSLIDKSSESGLISMHRLVQRAAIRRISTEEREGAFLLAMAIVAENFPDTYSADIGHQVASWKDCEKSLSHVGSIVDKGNEFKIFEEKNQRFAELLLRCSWYLYEKENYRLARSYVDIALKKIVDKDSLTYASAVDLGGLINLDICHPSAALKAFEQAYTIRKSVLPSDDLFLAASQVNLGLALTEIGEFEKAHGYLKQSIDIRIMHSSDRLGNSYSNMASLLLRMGKPDDAEAMLKSCPSLKDFSDETFFQTGNPRFSGSVLLVNPKSMIGTNVVQGYGAIEQNQVSVLRHETGELELARELLQECIALSEALPHAEGLGHLARANYKVSQVLEGLGNLEESTLHLEKAMNIRGELMKPDGDYVLVNGVASDFDNLVPWMLW